MTKFGACFVGCGEIVQSLGQKCMDIESANGSEQTEDKKLASPIQMEVDDVQSSDETQNSNNIECSERSNISCLDFLYEFCLTFLFTQTLFISFWSAFYVKTLSLFTFATLNTIIFSTLKNQVKSQEHECSLEFYMRSKAYPVLPNDSKNPNFSDLSLAYLSYTGMRSSTPIRS